MHPGTEERITVVKGLMKGMFDGDDKQIEPGETLVIPPGTPHVFQAEGETDIVFEFRPARRMETLFETLFGLARDGKVPKSGRPRLLQTAAIFKEYKDEIRPAGAPDFILRVIDLFQPLGEAGRAARLVSRLHEVCAAARARRADRNGQRVTLRMPVNAQT